MALEATDLVALYRLSDSSNRKTSIADIAAMGGATSDLQDVCDNGSTTTTGITADSLNIGLVSTLAANGDASFTGDLLVNDSSGIESTGVITAYRRSSTGTDNLQSWKSDFGSAETTVASINCDGDLVSTGDITAVNITAVDIEATGNFIGDGSQLTGLASTLQEVCDNGSTTTTGADFGGEVKINRPNDSDRAFVSQKAGVDKFVVTTQGAVNISGKLTAAIYDLESLPELP